MSSAIIDDTDCTYPEHVDYRRVFVPYLFDNTHAQQVRADLR